MSADVIPLADEDRAILAIESATVAGHTCKVVLVGEGAPDADALRALVARRIEAAPMLTRRLGGDDDAPAWVEDPRFDITAHVGPAPVAGPLDGAELRAEVARLFEERLDRSRPLWRMDVVPLKTGAAIVWRIHHALADGTAAMRYAHVLLWDPDRGDAPPAHAAHPAGAEHPDEERRRRHLAGFLHRELARSHDRSPFDGRIGGRREIAFAVVPMGALHDAAKRLAGATLNDAVLSVVTGALRSWVQERHGDLRDLHVRIPVSLHHEGDDAGNRDSFFTVPLPLGEGDPVTRLRAVREQTSRRKADDDAETMDTLLHELGRASPQLQRFAARVQESPRRFAINVSNVPGPRGAVHVLGAPVRSLHSIAEIGERHALRVAVVSVAGSLCFGLCADPAIVDDVQAMAGGVEAEAALLSRQ